MQDRSTINGNGESGSTFIKCESYRILREKPLYYISSFCNCLLYINVLNVRAGRLFSIIISNRWYKMKFGYDI